MKPVEAPVPNPLAATGHRAVTYRDPYGVALIIGPFNGPLLCFIPTPRFVAAATLLRSLDLTPPLTRTLNNLSETSGAGPKPRRFTGPGAIEPARCS
jgi:aldehyde dehydrogenase (NAD+)